MSKSMLTYFFVYDIMGAEDIMRMHLGGIKLEEMEEKYSIDEIKEDVKKIKDGVEDLKRANELLRKVKELKDKED